MPTFTLHFLTVSLIVFLTIEFCAGPPPTYKPAAALDRTTMQMDSQPFGGHLRSRPLAVPDPVVEPPAILTADFSRMGKDVPKYEGRVPQDGMLSAMVADSAPTTERGAPRVRRWACCFVLWWLHDWGRSSMNTCAIASM